MCNRHDRFVSVTNLLHELEWPSLKNRRTIARLAIMYKIYNNYAAFSELSLCICKPNYLGRHDHVCKIAEINVSSDKEKFTFLAHSIRDWNSLPSPIFESHFGSFKQFVSPITKLFNM